MMSCSTRRGDATNSCRTQLVVLVRVECYRGLNRRECPENGGQLSHASSSRRFLGGMHKINQTGQTLSILLGARAPERFLVLYLKKAE